ncbi:hypothetical protein RQM59_14180 [Flavobacteriaceae bacterium S356]|uniref:Uncharacterized protein n=1 Tax=Asprobacillus argus TaxID=3076534 RepID=A0ABU3LII4_9FLAO|nr:hypothetical protein [Flavobacteriaceae bacterium S356]
MKTLKTILVLIIMSLFLASCTDLINENDELVLDTIENTQGLTGDNGTQGGGGGKGG